MKKRSTRPSGPGRGVRPCWPWATGLSSEAHSAGVSVSATSTDSAMAATMVTENWR